MSVIGPDSRQVITSFGTFPFSTVTAVDARFGSGGGIGTGIAIAPNHVLTAGHNAYNASTNTNATALRATISANQNALNFRFIGATGDPAANVTNVNFVDNYNVTGNPGDDIALFTTSDAPIAASDVIGLIAFVDPATTTGLTIDTAGYPGDNVSGNIPGNTGARGRDLVRSPGAAESPGNIVFTSNGRFFYSQDVDTAGGQSGSGVWHTLDGDPNPRVLGIHAYGSNTNNSGVLITTDIYDEIIDQIEADSGTGNANDLPENAIIGGTANDDIFGSYRRERIIGNDGNDQLFGGGANDRLEGGDGVDQALFSEIFTNYDFTITDPSNPAFQFTHARGSQSDATDTTKDIEFGVFEFVDADENGTDDDGNLFFVPLQVDPNDNTKLKDGALITPEEDIVDNGGNKIGTITVESPAWMFDGDVNYTLTLGSEQAILYNFAYIFDSSGSMSGTRIVEAKAAYQELTQSLIDDGIAANSEFGVVDFDSSARLFAPLDAPTTISTINGLIAGGNTNFNSALVEAQNFFASRNDNATNIAYFLSDGFNNGPDFSSSAAQLQQLAEVRAFGIGNPSLSQLNIVDSDNAVVLSDPADLITEFNAATIDKNIIERIDVKLAGTVVDTITRDQLVEDTLGLKFEGTIDGLEVTRTAENDITFDVVFNDGTPTASLDYKITTGQEQVTQQTDNGTKQIITFSVNQTDFIESTQSQSISQENNQSNLENTVASQPVIREINANDLDNTIQVSDGQNTIFGNGGNDRFILLGGVNLVDGGVGIDTVEINKTQTDAGGVSKNGNVVNIGTDNTLLNVEFIQFSDVRLAVDTLSITPTLSLANQSISIAEGNTGSTTATFTVNLSSTTTEDVVIDFATRSDNADAGTDFIETTGQLTIAAGQSSGDITLEILGDTDVEGDESVSLDLSVVSGGTFANGATTATAGVNIVDDDSVISIPITGGDPTVVEGDSDAPSTLTLTLDRFGGLNGADTIKVEIIAAGDNPASASDFVNGFSSSEVTFAAGEDTKTIDIAINPDREIEGDETFGIKLTSISGTALVPSEDLIFTILNDDANTPPTITSNNNFLVAENTTTVGTITATDVDGNDFTFNLVGGADQQLFTINNSGELSFNNAPDFETAADADGDNNYQVFIGVSDGTETVTQDLTISVSNVNEPPTITSNPTFQVAENTTTVGIIAATDVDGNDLTFNLVGGTDQQLFTINDSGELSFNNAPDFETAADADGDNNYQVSVGVSDGSETVTQDLTVSVTNINEAPSDITLSNSSVAENDTAAVIGNLTVTDVDSSNFTYTVNDNRFEVVNSQLKLKDGESLDFETENSINLEITATDDGNPNQSFSKSLTIAVTNVNEAPTDIALSNSSVAENDTAAIIGNLTVTDVDSSNFTYAVNDNRFEVVNSQLKLKDGESLDFEAQSTINLQITATDDGNPNQSFSKSLTIAVTNVNEAPTDIALSNSSVAENDTAAVIGDLTVTDVDSSTFTYAVNDNRFEVVNSQLKLKDGESLDFETENSINLEVAATDDGNPNQSFTKNFALAVTNVNEAPTANDATFTVDENSISGTEVGIVSANDPENQTLNFAITSGNLDADGDSNLAFAIDSSTGTITVNDKDDFDFETTPTFNLEITAKDAGDLTDTADITVNLNDVSPAVFETESNNGIFTLNGGDATNIKFTLANNNTEKVNEVGVFVVDDENGNVGGNAPGSDGYLQAALQRSQVILSAISDRPTGFDLGDIERVLEVDSDARLGFYLVSNGTTDTALAQLEESGTTNLPIFFSDSSNLQVSDLVAEGFNLNWSDEAGSSDFSNLDLSVQLTQDVPTPGTQLQGESQQELIDLTDVTGQVSVSVEVHREAAFDNLIGFYQVLDANGGIDTNGDGVVDFNAGDAGYEQAALTNRITGLDLLQTDNQQTSTFDGNMSGGSILASFMVVDGTVDEAINNNAEVYFSFLGANSDGVDHIRLLGDNTFGFEDLAGGGDLDYNDMIVKVDFTTV